MVFLLGIDEAGYGSNLGPLVVAGSLWEVADQRTSEDLYEAFAPDIDNDPHTPCLTICDSKRLHQSQRNVARLEENILPVWRSLAAAPGLLDVPLAMAAELADHAVPLDWSRLARLNAQPSLAFNGQATTADSDEDAEADEWCYFSPKQLVLPMAGDHECIAERTRAFHQATARAGVRLVQLGFVEVSPRRFNQGLAQLRSKGTLLTGISLLLADALWRSCASAPLCVVFDKHGGRDQYGFALRAMISERLQIELESESISRYMVQRGGDWATFEFRARGESHLPTALASMAAKYVREVRMEMWNRFWRLQVPQLAPTKGYPADARRFLEAIRPTMNRLQVPLDDVWRAK